MTEEVKIQTVRYADVGEELESQISSHSNYLKKVISGILRNPADAEDAYQEVVHKIYCGYSGWRRVNFKAWIARIAVNHCLDCKKKISKEAGSIDLENLEVELPDSADPLSASVCSPREILLAREMREEIRQILLDLPEIYRQVLLMYYETSLTIDEIAERLGLGHRTVETRIYRARKMVSEKWRYHAH